MFNLRELYTIGYEGFQPEVFVEYLQTVGIETVVDIRELPLSRKRGFSKCALAASLNKAKIEYLHIARLGCPKAIRHQYRQDRDWKSYTVKYLPYLSEQTDAVRELSAIATASRCVLMCFESDHTFCHRSYVAGAVQNLFIENVVMHLSYPDTRTETHGNCGRELA